jgi:uncharacterized membrane protein
MEKIKNFIIKTFVFLINAALVVGGVFLIKNQNDKNKESQAADLPVSNESANSQNVNEEISNDIVQDQKSVENVSDDISTGVSDNQNQQTTPAAVNNNTPAASPVVKSVPAPAPKAVPKPKKTTKTS